MACVATWSFGLQAVEVASKCIKYGKSCIDAIESAINGRLCKGRVEQELHFFMI